jgi:actinorhodin biosynthesis protein ActVIA
VSRAELHFEIQQFYACQIRCLDDGDAAGFAATFTEDAVFIHDPGETVEGRANIAAATETNVAKIRETKVVRRHWFGMIIIEPGGDDQIRTQYAATTTLTAPDGGAALGTSSLVDDVLVRRDGRLSTASRTVHSDRIAR